MSFLVDTNVLLRIAQRNHSLHKTALALEQLLAGASPVYFTLQNMAEFWNVATRPVERNGLGYSVAFTLAELEKLENVMEILPDSSQVYARWKRLVVEHEVSGVQVHDARLVAMMLVHGVSHLMTFDLEDFARYTEIEILDPANLPPQLPV